VFSRGRIPLDYLVCKTRYLFFNKVFFFQGISRGRIPLDYLAIKAK